jgi:23S rRNA-/tRNA-specific pseudouridylate synthase
LKQSLRNNAYFCDGIDDFTEPLESINIENLEIIYEDESLININKSERKCFEIGTRESKTKTLDTINIKIVYPSLEKTEWGFQSSAGEF